MYNTSSSFDSVFIVESLPDGELKTGLEVFDRVIRPHTFNNPGLLSEVYQPKTKREFVGVLRHINSLSAKFGRAPFLQLDCHGSRAGLLLGSEERVSWSELAPILTDINKTCQMNLVVVAAMCNGWYLSDVLRPTDRSPIFAIIGSKDEVPAGVLLDSMARLYSSLLTPPHDLRAALSAANVSNDVTKWQFEWIGAELMLCRVFQCYMETIEADESHAERVNHLVAEIARAGNLDINQSMQVRAGLSADLQNHARWFAHYRTNFLMLDLFPANERRFPLSYEDCGRPAA